MVSQKCCTFAIIMANTYTQLFTHIVFHTKSTGIVMRDEDMARVFQYIGGIIRDEGAIPFVIGGVADHIHILMSLPKTVALSDLMRVIKAKSSKWLRRLDSYYEPFSWQDGYGAFSVSNSHVDAVVAYIKGQEEHHKKVSFQDELRRICELYNVNLDERYAWD